MFPFLNLEEYSLVAAFVIGILHVLEPCEDKAIASLYIAWAGKALKRCLLLVFIYSIGMVIINTILGFFAAYLGAHYLENFQHFLRLGAAIFTIFFGFLIIFHSHLFETHCHIKIFKKIDPTNLKSVIGFGIVRGLPLCPIEIGIMLWAASVGSILYGTLLVFVFSVGTAISLIPFALGAKGILAIVEKKVSQKARRLVPLLVGAIIILIGVFLLFGHVDVH